MDRFGGGWTRVADIKAVSGSCPGNLRFQALEKMICSRPETHTGLCASSQFNSLVSSYSEVMGFVTGYAVSYLFRPVLSFFIFFTDHVVTSRMKNFKINHS